MATKDDLAKIVGESNVSDAVEDLIGHSHNLSLCPPGSAGGCFAARHVRPDYVRWLSGQIKRMYPSCW
jgi:hypothetical protein